MHDGFRREREQTASAATEMVRKRQRRAVEHHADQHDRGHDEGALGRDLGAGQQQIEGRDDQAPRARPIS